jgi:DNA-binding NtrC family response regulator
MTLPDHDHQVVLLVSHQETRDYLVSFLKDHEYLPRVVGNAVELMQVLREHPAATVFVDCQAVIAYGSGLLSRIRVTAPQGKLIFLCQKEHGEHRGLVREAMELGAYGCLLAPFADWEVLTMVRPSLVTKPPGRRPPKRKERG